MCDNIWIDCYVDNCYKISIMVITSYTRGHKILFDVKQKKWFYVDTEKETNDERACKRCGKKPTKEGYDYCLGYIENATSACCGHGVEKAYIMEKEVKKCLN